MEYAIFIMNLMVNEIKRRNVRFFILMVITSLDILFLLVDNQSLFLVLRNEQKEEFLVRRIVQSPKNNNY